MGATGTSRICHVAAAVLTLCWAMPAIAQDGVAGDEITADPNDPERARTAGQITVYGWLAGYNGTIRPGATAPTFKVDKSFSELFEDSDGFFFASGLVRHNRIVVVADVSHSRSSKDGDVPTGNPLLPFVPAEGKLKQTSVTVAGGYRAVDAPTVTLDVLGGIRAWSVKAKVEAPLLGASRSAEADFVDPIVAARLNYRFARRWSVILYGDLGGFGSGSDFTSQAVATVNFRMTNHLWLSGGYRQLHVDYKKNGVRVDSTLGGPVVGVTLAF